MTEMFARQEQARLYKEQQKQYEEWLKKQQALAQPTTYYGGDSVSYITPTTEQWNAYVKTQPGYVEPVTVKVDTAAWNKAYPGAGYGGSSGTPTPTFSSIISGPKNALTAALAKSPPPKSTPAPKASVSSIISSIKSTVSSWGKKGK
jgi:hypothetical protein